MQLNNAQARELWAVSACARARLLRDTNGMKKHNEGEDRPRWNPNRLCCTVLRVWLVPALQAHHVLQEPHFQLSVPGLPE
eukprot:6833516-Alexandrium_andersonii.AAC.1